MTKPNPITVPAGVKITKIPAGMAKGACDMRQMHSQAAVNNTKILPPPPSSWNEPWDRLWDLWDDSDA